MSEVVKLSEMSEKAQKVALKLRSEGKTARAHKRAHWSVTDEPKQHYKEVEFDVEPDFADEDDVGFEG